jgi:L-asparaginase II
VETPAYSYTYSYRGQLIENRHRISLAISRPSGDLLAYSGNPHLVTHMRSSAKPFQLQALFLSGAVEKFNLTPAELALTCASHDGLPMHVSGVQNYLEKLELTAQDLACGAHFPFDTPTRQAMQKAGQTPTVLHNNCSGKHSGMLAAALALGVPTKNYQQPDHPVQALNLQILRDLSGQQAIPYGIDGCSVPTFALPLHSAAHLFAQLAEPLKYSQGLEAAFSAMSGHPELVAGPNSIDTQLMQQVPQLVAKRGADGYYGMALRNTQWGNIGIALKVEDGSNDAREPFVVALLEALGLPVVVEWTRPQINNVRKLEVGHLEAKVNLVWTQ